jgi:hypothetical protein
VPAQSVDGEPAKPALRVEDLPAIDSLTLDSDFTAFLKEGVPEELKKLALRKLWASDPFLAKPEVLDLYNLDFSMPVATEAVKTLYQVGKGMALPEDEEKPTVQPRPEASPEASPAPAAPEGLPAPTDPNTGVAADPGQQETAAVRNGPSNL